MPVYSRAVVPLKRARYVRARGIDQLGQPAIVEGEGQLARCIQHEVDHHLNGRLFVDRLSGSARKLAMRDLREDSLADAPDVG